MNKEILRDIYEICEQGVKKMKACSVVEMRGTQKSEDKFYKALGGNNQNLMLYIRANAMLFLLIYVYIILHDGIAMKINITAGLARRIL